MLRLSRALLVGAVLVTLAIAAGPSSAATSGGGSKAATPDCSPATAALLVDRHGLNSFLLPNPVRQVLCGSFTGAGSEAMAVTIGAPTCWPVQRWAVFRFVAGAWQLVLDQTTFINPPLVAVGSDIREERPIFRAGDPRCLPSGGTQARVWRWNGTQLVAGPWTQVKPGDPLKHAIFVSPRGIECWMNDNTSSVQVRCHSGGTYFQSVILRADGRIRTCRVRGYGCGVGNAGEDPVPRLAYGQEITVGRFRCASLRAGVRCTVTRTGRGFVISRSGVRRLP